MTATESSVESDAPAVDARPLRVLHLRNSDVFGGPERLILDQARLAAPHVTPILASFGRTTTRHPFLDRAADAGITTVLVPQEGSYDPRTPFKLSKVLDQFAPDVLVGHDYKADLTISIAGGARPRVAVVHGYTAEDVKVRFFEAVDRHLLKKMAAVVVVSDALRARLVDEGVPPARLHLVPNGIHADRVAAVAHGARKTLRDEWGVDEGTRLVLVLGRLSPEKGQDVLLDALARSEQSDLRAVLVGDGASREALRLRAKARGLADRVRLAGWRDDPWACLGAADALVLPSRREGLPLALLEAMAAGVAVVATDVGDVKAVLENGRCGLVVPPEDAPALAAAIDELFEDEEATQARTARAARRVRDRYGVEEQTRRLEAIYAAARQGVSDGA